MAGFAVFFDHTAALTLDASPPASHGRDALGRERASPEVRHMAQWALDSHDHEGLPFVVVDKARARLFAFDANGVLRASTPVLLGAGRGDAADAPATPAGRFVLDTWQSALGGGMVWVNDRVAISLHGLPSPASPGRASQRLASDRVEDKRISDGSLHVPGRFYREVLAPLRGGASIAYVLPEVLPVREVFSSRAHDRGQRLAQRLTPNSRRHS